MQVEIIQDVERVFDIELAWDELYQLDPHAHIYLSSRFLSPIAIRSAGKFRILVAWSEDRQCVGLLPLVLMTRWSQSAGCLYNVLDMMGHVFDADYTGILCDPTVEKEVCTAFATKIAAMPMGRLIFNFFDGPDSRLTAFTKGFDAELFEQRTNEQRINDGKTNNLICPYIDLADSFDGYLARLSTNARQKLRRLLRQLDSNKNLRITRSRPETYTEDVTILSKLWYLQYAEQKGHKRATHLAELFKEVIMLGLASGMVHLALLWRNGKPVAAQANYIDPIKRHALFHVAGRDVRVEDLSTGMMLQAHCIRWAIANGMTRYDFTIGDEPYKYSLGAQDREITSREIWTKSFKNIGATLDPDCQDDVLKHMRQYALKDRHDDARTAARQALDIWPNLAPDGDLDALIMRVTSKARKK